MPARVRKYLPAFLILSWLAAACDGNGGGARISSTAPTSLGSDESVRLAAEPETIRPRLLSGTTCTAEPPFQASLAVIVRASEPVVVQGLGFEFIDRSGARTVPQVTPGSTTAASIPTTLPVPLPTSSPVPVPPSGALPTPAPGAAGLPVSPADRLSLPFLLQFGCGVPASGTLVIVVSASNAAGDGETSETRVGIGR